MKRMVRSFSPFNVPRLHRNWIILSVAKMKDRSYWNDSRRVQGGGGGGRGLALPTSAVITISISNTITQKTLM